MSLLETCTGPKLMDRYIQAFFKIEVSLIQIFIIQAAVVIIRKMYLVQNEK